MKLWKKRWFVLSDLCLFYYRGGSRPLSSCFISAELINAMLAVDRWFKMQLWPSEIWALLSVISNTRSILIQVPAVNRKTLVQQNVPFVFGCCYDIHRLYYINKNKCGFKSQWRISADNLLFCSKKIHICHFTRSYYRLLIEPGGVGRTDSLSQY